MDSNAKIALDSLDTAFAAGDRGYLEATPDWNFQHELVSAVVHSNLAVADAITEAVDKLQRLGLPIEDVHRK